MMEKFDVVVVGAGLSGVGAGVHLTTKCPTKKIVILEGRESLGGTWDLFRYPGIRSDSDMFTLGYSFKPWTANKSLADGSSILTYIRETAQEYGVDKHIRYRHKVVEADWDSDRVGWIVTAKRGPAGETVKFACKFLFMCTGYYNYEQGYSPEFPDMDKFQGQIIHPQKWPENFDYTGKQVVVIGSGATAITIVPAMTDAAAHVTMLQRSPTYVVSLPEEDKTAIFLRRFLPMALVYILVRIKNVFVAMLLFFVSRTFPNFMRKLLLAGVKKALGSVYKAHPDTLRHFTPTYNPWDQRMCFVPNGDFFRAIKRGQASVVTDHVQAFTPTGIKLKSGQELKADVIITATGLDLLAFGGMALVVDGKKVVLGDTVSYRGVMLSGLPNMGYVLGYTNASWTLKADLACEFFCRLLQEMQERRLTSCVPRINPGSKMELSEWSDFSSGYFQRAVGRLPKQGSHYPWKVNQNYLKDIVSLRYGTVLDETLQTKARL